MKLQAALDDISLQDAIALLEKVQDHVDIVEVGTPFLMEYGLGAVRTIREKFPRLEILCDAKIMDAGAYEAEHAFAAGSDYVTVLGVTDDRTVAEVVSCAKKAGKKVMVDMICVADLASRIKTMEDLDVDIIAVHTGIDQQAAGRTPLDDLIEMRKHVKKAQLAVAGGISIKTVDAYLENGAHIIIAGGCIAHAADPAAAAKELAERIHTYNA
ncbi:MAG: 3-hexulose-6-phosphate synthase [Christensenellaceae bacterium]|nr:3-hexulose-6-phosphate synthase [Christensenellaceae bacterium]